MGQAVLSERVTPYKDDGVVYVELDKRRIAI